MNRIVKADFFCAKSRINYKKGDIYTGDRNDLEHVLEPIKREKKGKPTRTKKERK